MWLTLHALLYAGEAQRAWQLVCEYRPHFVRAGYRDINPWATVLPLFDGAAGLAAAQVEAGRRSYYLRVVDRAIRPLGRLPWPFAAPSSVLLAAGRAQLLGQPAFELYAAAAEGYEAQGLRGYAASARMRQAQLAVAHERAALEQSALAWFAAQGIVRPDRWTRMYAPIEPVHCR